MPAHPLGLALSLATTAAAVVAGTAAPAAAQGGTASYVLTTAGAPDAALALVDDLGGDVGHGYRHALTGSSDRLPVTALPVLAALPGVAAVEADGFPGHGHAVAGAQRRPGPGRPARAAARRLAHHRRGRRGGQGVRRRHRRRPRAHRLRWAGRPPAPTPSTAPPTPATARPPGCPRRSRSARPTPPPTTTTRPPWTCSYPAHVRLVRLADGDRHDQRHLDGHPHVAGVAALLLSAAPSSTPAQVAQQIVSTATPGVVKDPGSGSPDLLLVTR